MITAPSIYARGRYGDQSFESARPGVESRHPHDETRVLARPFRRPDDLRRLHQPRSRSRPGAAARCRRRAAAEHRLDLERGHEPAPGRLRRRGRAHADARSPRDTVDQVHPCVHDRAGVRAEPCRHHHGDVPDGDRGAAHAHHRRHGPRAARAISGRSAVLRQGVSRIPARRRLLHQQSREDRLPVRRAFHDLGRLGGRRTGAIAPTGRSRSSRCSTSKSRTRAGSFPEPGAQGQAARHRPREDQGAALLSRHPGRPRRARAHVRQHRRHGRPGRRRSSASSRKTAWPTTPSCSIGAITATACRAPSARSTIRACACR